VRWGPTRHREKRAAPDPVLERGCYTRKFLMYFNFEDSRPDTPTIATPLSRREGVLLSIVLHLLFVIAILVTPQLPFMQELERQRVEAREQERLRELEEARRNARFVFVQPRVDLRAPEPPVVADLSDLDRRRQTVERPRDAENSLPFSRGNSPERIESAPPSAPAPAPAPAPPEEPASQPAGDAAKPGLTLPESLAGLERPGENGNKSQVRGPSTGVIADAIRNVEKYVEREGFRNPRGGANQDLRESIQFDSKGVEFGPWLRRFVAQIRRNWFVPQAAMTMHGHVVITFFVHKDGRLTDLQIVKASAIDGFNNSAFGALASSNPTYPLPPEYPDDKCFFTVIFYFNETPQAP
jgi:TonB family protein